MVWNIFKEEVDDWVKKEKVAPIEGSVNVDSRRYFAGGANVNAARNCNLELQCHKIVGADGIA